MWSGCSRCCEGRWRDCPSSQLDRDDDGYSFHSLRLLVIASVDHNVDVGQDRPIDDVDSMSVTLPIATECCTVLAGASRQLPELAPDGQAVPSLSSLR